MVTLTVQLPETVAAEFFSAADQSNVCFADGETRTITYYEESKANGDSGPPPEYGWGVPIQEGGSAPVCIREWAVALQTEARADHRTPVQFNQDDTNGGPKGKYRWLGSAASGSSPGVPMGQIAHHRHGDNLARVDLLYRTRNGAVTGCVTGIWP